MATVIRMLVVGLAVFILQSCESYSSYGAIAEHQGVCEKSYRDFPSAVGCLKGKLAKDRHSRGRDADFIKIYLLKADVLVERFNVGAISQTEARQHLAILHYCLKTVVRSQPSGIGALGHILSSTGAGMQGRPAPYVPPRDATHCLR